MTQQHNGHDARIDELQARLAHHQDQAVHELSEEVYRQQRQIGDLEVMLRQLSARVAAAEQGHSSGEPSDEVPPHY